MIPSWQPIAHASELSTPGDYVVLPIDGGADVAVTNVDGALLVFDNRCPHRGARIFHDRAGRRAPQCLYHGRMVTAASARIYPHATWGGFIFVRPDRRGQARQPELPFAHLTDIPADLRLHSTLAYTYPCDWRVAVENALDYEHVTAVHPGSLGRLGLTPTALQRGADGSSLHVFRCADRRLARAARLFVRPAPPDYWHAHFFPYTALSSTAGMTYSLQHYLPGADGRCDFIHRMYAAPTRLPAPEFFDSAAALNARVFAEDAAIVAHVPPGDYGQLGPHDARIAHFRSYL